MSGLSDQLREICREVAQGVAKGTSRSLGPLLDHIRGLKDLPPEICQLDSFVFEATIGAAVLTQPSAPVKIPGGYYAEVMGMSGYISSPGVAVDDVPRVTFNILQQGKRNLFTTDQSLAQLVNILGPVAPIYWPRSLYRFDAGGDVQTKFARASGWAGANRTVGVVLIVGLVAAERRDLERA